MNVPLSRTFISEKLAYETLGNFIYFLHLLKLFNVKSNWVTRDLSIKCIEHLCLHFVSQSRLEFYWQCYQPVQMKLFQTGWIIPITIIAMVMINKKSTQMIQLKVQIERIWRWQRLEQNYRCRYFQVMHKFEYWNMHLQILPRSWQTWLIQHLDWLQHFLKFHWKRKIVRICYTKEYVE